LWPHRGSLARFLVPTVTAGRARFRVNSTRAGTPARHCEIRIFPGSQPPGRGAGYLLMVTVHRWRDAQTQYDGEPDGIDMTVRLTRPGSAEVAGEFDFHAQGSRLAVRDEAAGRLLDDKLRRAIGQLLRF